MQPNVGLGTSSRAGSVDLFRIIPATGWQRRLIGVSRPIGYHAGTKALSLLNQSNSILPPEPCCMSEPALSAIVLTPPGRGAIATIRVNGNLHQLQEKVSAKPERFFVPRNNRTVADQPVDQILFGHWGTEDLVACRIAKDAFEIHCHGGPAAIGRILDDLEELGTNIVREGSASPDSQTATDWLADLEATVVHSRTLRTAELIWSQRKAIPFWTELEQKNQQGQVLSPETEQQLPDVHARAEFGRHLTEPWNVVIGGAPNAGKSSLINALLGYERAIVFDQPGTTRDAVKAETAIDGWPVLLSDTAGQRTAEESIEAAGIEIARQLLRTADLAILLIDRSAASDSDVETLLATFPQALLVFNKCDRPAHPDWSSRQLPSIPLEISCQTESGLETLLSAIATRLVPQPPPGGSIIPVSSAQRRCLTEALGDFNAADAPSISEN